jgi:hypothetical protein
MAIIHQYDKRSGITYAYESHSYWDKEKKTSRAKRTLIGRVNPDTGEIVPTDGRCRKDNPRKDKAKNPDYKILYEKLQRKCISQESLIAALQKELNTLKKKDCLV